MEALVLCGTVHTATAMVLFGTLAVRLWLAVPLSTVGGGHRLIVSAAWLALGSAVAWLLLESAAMADDAVAMVDPDAIAAVLGGTAFGRVWQSHLGFSAAAVGGVIFWPRNGRLQLVFATLQLAGLGLIGHAAMEEGVVGVFQRATQTVHLLAGGAWLGALPSLTLLVAAAAPEEREKALRRFTGFGATAVVLLLLSGSLNVWMRTGGRLDTFGTPYGRIILIKLALVAGMIALAMVNRFVLTPALSRTAMRGQRWLGVSLGVETILGLLVLAVAFVLGNTAPP